MYVEISTQEVANVAAKGEIHVVYKKKIVDEKMYKQCKGKINKEHNYNKGRSGKKFGTVLWGNTSLYCPDPYQIPIAVNIEIDTSPPIHWRSKKSKKSLKYLKALDIFFYTWWKVEIRYIKHINKGFLLYVKNIWANEKFPFDCQNELIVKLSKKGDLFCYKGDERDNAIICTQQSIL